MRETHLSSSVLPQLGQAGTELARTSSDPGDRAKYDQLVSDMEGQQVTAEATRVPISHQ